MTFTHTPYLDFLLDSTKYYSCLTPIYLNGFGRGIGQWYKYITHLVLEFRHSPSYRSFTAFKTALRQLGVCISYVLYAAAFAELSGQNLSTS